MASLGALVAHQVAYGVVAAVAPATATPNHGYLGVVARLVVPAGFVALGVVAARAGRRRLDLAGRSVMALTLLQVAIFGSQETLEWLLLGGTPLHANAAVWIGIAIQPLVALALLTAARVGVGLVYGLERGAAGRSTPRRTPERVGPSFVDHWVTMFDLLGPRRRGPPVVA